MSAMVEPRVSRARANALGWGDETTDVPRRRPGRIVAGAIGLVLSGWLAAAVYLSVGSREEVVALARPVNRFSELTRDDLRVVRVASDPDISLVPAEDLDALVGRTAATELVEGTLLHDDHLLDADSRLVQPGEATVGAVLTAQDSPSDLAAGADVEVFVRSPDGAADTGLPLDGWVLDVEDVDLPGAAGQRVTLVVPREAAASVSVGAAEDRVSVAVVRS